MLGGIKVILTALVNHSQIALRPRIVIWQDSVDLVKFQRSWIVGVVYTYCETICRFFELFHHLVTVPLAFDFFPAYAVRFVRKIVNATPNRNNLNR